MLKWLVPHGELLDDVRRMQTYAERRGKKIKCQTKLYNIPLDKKWR